MPNKSFIEVELIKESLLKEIEKKLPEEVKIMTEEECAKETFHYETWKSYTMGHNDCLSEVKQKIKTILTTK